MPHNPKKKPAVLVLAAHDPSGGAGIQADIETLAVHDCIAIPVITSLTAQNTKQFSHHLPQTAEHFSTQLQMVMDDIDIVACKIGAIGSPQLLQVIHDFISDNSLPVVFDPVLRSTTGYSFADPTSYSMLCDLLPTTTVLSPNLREALLLTGKLEPKSAAKELLAKGCEYILITDTEPSNAKVVNHLYHRNGHCHIYTWERLHGNYHGSGCTLSAAISAGLAKKIDPKIAIEYAQKFTWYTLKNGLEIGRDQLFPNRFFNQAEMEAS